MTVLTLVTTLAALWHKTTLKGTPTGRRVFSLPALSVPEPADVSGGDADDVTGAASGGDGIGAATSLFKQQYDKTQKSLESIAAMDDLLSGMLI